MWKTWSGWLRAMGAWLAMMASGGIGAYSTAYDKIPKPPEPGFLKVCYWAVDPANGWPFIGALVAGLGLIASLVQLFGPKPAGESLVKALARWNDERAQSRHAELQGQVWDEGHASEERDDLTHRLLTGDITERVAAAVDADVLSDEQKRRLRALADRIEAETPATADQALRAAETAFALQDSPELEERRAAGEAIGGDLEAAADRLMAEAEAGKVRNAERFRQAARLYAPSAPSKAMEAYREAVDLDPTDLWSWIELGRLRMQYSSLADARSCFASALQRVTDERDRMAVHGAFGNLLAAEGQLSDATAEYSASHVISERLAAREPGNAHLQRDLSVSHNKLGVVAVAAGDLATARRHYESDLAIAERLAALEPGNAELQRDLSVSHNKLGDLAVAGRDFVAARRHYKSDLAIAERLAARDPSNAEWQRDLSVSHNKLGHFAMSGGNLEEARQHFSDGLEIRERLAAREPENAEWQRDLSVSYHNLGDLAVLVDDLDEGRRRYDAGFAIAERLAIQEPKNAVKQRGLFISNAKLAQLAEARGDFAGAIEHFTAAKTVMVELVERLPEHPGFADDLADVQRDLARLHR